MKRWLYPGTFDPPTNGHMDLVHRARRLCDELIIAVAESREKATFFNLEERLHLMQQAVADLADVRVVSFDILLTEQVEREQVDAVLRGVRAVSDFEYELQMALVNRKLLERFETIFMMPSEQHIYLSSSLVKEIMRYGGDISAFVPSGVVEAMKRMVKRPSPPGGAS
jgi:pantetheine-phosphate adenylyltransferase